MKLIVVGSGGREHAIAWKLAQNSAVEMIYCLPGNGGTAMEAKCKNINLKSIEEILDFAKSNLIDFTVVGPEEPLIKGIVDSFKREGLKIFGPAQKGAMLEGSKIVAKDFMKKYGVKTAEYASFDDIDSAVSYSKKCSYPAVIKADGLAAGKGVVICATLEEAETTLKDFMVNDIFKGSGKSVVIEEFLDGVEASILSITDGKTIIPFISAKDHKQIYDGNKGPNTGGMGAVAPNPYCTEEVLNAFEKDIMEPTINGIISENMDYTGIIFFGIMITAKGVYLLEYNVRMGDPETQAVLTLMESDLLELLLYAVDGRLKEFNVEWKSGAACCVVAASGGYPAEYQVGLPISIPEKMKSKCFAAGAVMKGTELVTSGGRVLAVTAAGSNVSEAITQAYEDMAKVEFKDIYYRKDIGTSR